MSASLLAALFVVATMAATASGPAMAAVYTLEDGGSAMFGREERVTTVHEDTLYDIARRFGLGSEEIVRVNPGIDPWLPRADRNIVIPGQRMLPSGPRDGIVVNLPEHRLYYYPKTPKGQPQLVYTYPVSIGKMDWHTPLGKTRIVDKREKPTWTPPESVRKEHIANGDPVAGGGAGRSGQPSGRIRHAAGAQGRLPHPWHQQPPGRGHGGHPRLHPHVSRRTSRSFSPWFRWARRCTWSTSRSRWP